MECRMRQCMHGRERWKRRCDNGGNVTLVVNIVTLARSGRGRSFGGMLSGKNETTMKNAAYDI